MEEMHFESTNIPQDILRHLSRILKNDGLLYAKLKKGPAPLIIFLNSFPSEQEAFKERCHQLQFTSRETEIATLIEKGLSYKEIGSQLHISIKTVSRHIHNIYFKAEVNTKTALIRKLKGNS